MFNGEQWNSTRKLIAATPIAFIAAIVVMAITFPLGDIGVWISMPVFLVAGVLNLICLFMFYSDSKKTAERTGKQPRWWAYIGSSVLFSAALTAPIYLYIWRGQ